MANLTTIYSGNPVALDPGDLMYAVENTGTTPVKAGFKAAQLMLNRYKITPTVSANDLILALKHEDGTDPSTDRPLYFKIGNSLRACTAALSVTKADGTDWAALGTSMAAKEADLFCYLVWNTNLTPDAIDIFWSRVPYGRVYADFPDASTGDRHAAVNATVPAATDDCIVIGRFAATLSAGAGFTWTVPTYSSANLIHQQIFETRWMDWVVTQVGFSAVPTAGIARYKVDGNEYKVNIRNGTGGASNATTFTFNLPLVPKTLTNATWQGFATIEDNSAVSASPGRIVVSSGSATATVYSNATTGAWTSGGPTKRIAGMAPLVIEL